MLYVANMGHILIADFPNKCKISPRKINLLFIYNHFSLFQHDADLIFDDLIDSNSLPNGINPLSSPSLSHDDSHNHSRSRSKRRVHRHHISDDEDFYRDAEDGPSGFFPDESGDFGIPGPHVDTKFSPDTRVTIPEEGPCEYSLIILFTKTYMRI